MTRREQREFVADPAQGSKHNRGCAVDLTLYDLAIGDGGGDAERLRRDDARARIPTTRAARRKHAASATCCAR